MRLFPAFAVLAALTVSVGASTAPSPIGNAEEVAVTHAAGRPGGRLVVSLRAEPRTFNPVVAADVPSRDVLGRMHADLIHINRGSQATEPALARSWTRSADGRQYTLALRRGIRFSDGTPLTADDVVFSFAVVMDERVGSPQRDLLIVGGKPIEVAKVDAQTVRVSMAQPYAAAERLFDSIAIVPAHLLRSAYEQGRLAEAWTLTTNPQSVAGLGPYRLKEYVAGERIVLERNPYYWKADASRRRLPYLDELVFTVAGTEDAQVLRFENGEADVLGRIGADNFGVLSKSGKGYQLKDAGPSLENNFLVFNQNDLAGKNLPQVAAKQAWFTNVLFRQAVSRAIDREGLARLIYRGRGEPLWTSVAAGNRLWVNNTLARPPQSAEAARALLRQAGFSWRPDGALVDRAGQRVEFTIATSSSNAQRTQMATVIQQDLRRIGMDVTVVPLEFRALVDRVFQTFDYDAAILGLAGGDADPNSEMSVWMSTGSNHLWRLEQSAPATAWEAELDRLMQKQLVTTVYAERKRLFDRVQAIAAEQAPLIFLAAPHVLVGARADLGNFQPAVLDHNTLWNVEELFLRPQAQARQ